MGLAPHQAAKTLRKCEDQKLASRACRSIVPDRTEMLGLKNIRFNAHLGEMTAVEFADHLRIAFGAIAH
ncbi:MAG: hypothetical protein BHW60_01910 [Sutterella sp. 54_7]|nr:MAG: hypothetical protein BHW60_01910 [Sutterella sp. 54_7]